MIVDPVKINSYTYKTKEVKCPNCHSSNIIRLNNENKGCEECWTCGQLIIYLEKEYSLPLDNL